MATHEQATQVTRGMRGVAPLTSLHDETSWGTAALKHTTSWQHIDDEGFATMVTNMVGLKYWVVTRRQHGGADTSPHGRMDSAVAFGPTLRPRSASDDLFDHEGVLLSPGSVLYVILSPDCPILTCDSFMRPSTPHYVLTVEDSITYGRHFYCASTISNSVYGIIHCFVLGFGVMNVQHDNTRTLMRRIMAMWYKHFVVHGEEDSPGRIHAPW